MPGHFLPLPPPLVMAADPQVLDLRAVRTHVGCAAPDWERLERAVAALPSTITSDLLLSWQYTMVPAPALDWQVWSAAIRALGLFLASPVARERRSSGPLSLGPLASASVVAPGRTPQQRKSGDTLSSHTPHEVVQQLRDSATAKYTQRIYRAAVPLYEASCVRATLVPPTIQSMEVFAGYLKASGAYLGPAVYWFGVLEEARDRGLQVDFDSDSRWTSRVVTAMLHGLPAEEQAEPLTLPVLRVMGAAVVTDIDYLLLLTLVGAIFTCSRADSFVHLSAQDIQDISPSRVRVLLLGLKGEVRQEIVDPVFDALEVQTSGPWMDIDTSRGPVPLCPVRLFRSLRERAVTAGAVTVAQATYNSLLRRLNHLMTRAGVPTRVPDRRRNLYSMHSTRVAAVCYLLKAGLNPTIFSVLCNWSSDQIRRYGARLVLDLHLVEAWAFYNPVSMSHSYGVFWGPVASPSAKSFALCACRAGQDTARSVPG